MFNLQKFIKRNGKLLLIFVLFVAFVVGWYLAVSALLSLAGEQLELLPALLSGLLVSLAVMLAWRLTARFVAALYDVSHAQADAFMGYRLLGRSGFSPYLIIREGKIAFGEDIVKKIGGPAGLVIYNDTAVITEQAGRLKRVIRGPAFPSLEPFEKVWDVIDMRPQRWVFSVSAITSDGIPIDYDADVRFQVRDTEQDIFKAATSKWVRDAWRTEPDRLMIWTKRVIIGETEGITRAILAHYTLNQLIDPNCRAAVRDELRAKLSTWAAGIGVEIVHVALGDIRLRGQVVQQWIETWRAEREHQASKIIVEGKAKRAKMLEQARAQVRRHMLDKTIDVFNQAAAAGQRISSRLVVLSFIEMLKRTSFEQSLYLPTDMVKTIDMLQKRATGSSSDSP